jgi:hypothetical protein
MRFSTQQWQELFKEQDGSGLSIAAFCRDKNIKVKNFYNNRSNHLKKYKFHLLLSPRSLSLNLQVQNIPK